MTKETRPQLHVDDLHPRMAIYLQWVGDMLEHVATTLDAVIVENHKAHADLKAEICKLAVWRKEVDGQNHDEKVKQSVWKSQGKGLIAGASLVAVLVGIAERLGLL